ncbi:hypothetical protein AAFF_G00347140 [Aldrovandia affinis]|uniref:CCHC-type domain-containing protein n=1 Tax=Aldrovandia affinis TaxID=143900 RepID=A0AAD7SJP2_9TELE|nr:hypothetical protein AAFF_G00347140 [Aldrovandia affinis]
MPHVQGLKVLDDCEENQKLLQKLPDWATTRWNRHVTRELNAGKPYPSFKAFSPTCSRRGVRSVQPDLLPPCTQRGRRKTGKDKRLKVSTLATSAKVSQKSKRADHQDKDSSASDGDKGSRESKRPVECICCKEKHFIYKCEKFTAMSQEEKKRFILDNKMCYGCLRVGHVAKECKKELHATSADGTTPHRFMWSASERGTRISATRRMCV